MYTEIIKNLEKLHLKFKLGEEQKEVLSQVFQCIDTKLPLVTSITGSAGTGKSTIIKLIVAYLDLTKRLYVLASPTHKAKTVLMSYTQKSAVTLHSLLNLSAIVDIVDFDYKNLTFDFNDTTKRKNLAIPKDGVLIIDECSMVNKLLYEYIEELASEKNCMLLFIGDPNQLKPVKDKTISQVFTSAYTFALTKIYRQKGDNPILDLLDQLKTTIITNFSSISSPKGNLLLYDKWKELLSSTIHIFKSAVLTEDIGSIKLLAYTNNRVNAFNKVIREQIFENEEEYNIGEFLIGCDNCMINNSNRCRQHGDSINNAEDYIIKHIYPDTKKIINSIYVGYTLELYSPYSLKDITCFILSATKNSVQKLNILSQDLENLRLDAVMTPKYNKKLYAIKWKKYFSTMEDFLTPIDLVYNNRVIRKKSLDYGYCITVHKSQGSTFKTTLVDMGNIFKCRNKEELQQLQYVAMSRTNKDIHMLL